MKARYVVLSPKWSESSSCHSRSSLDIAYRIIVDIVNQNSVGTIVRYPGYTRSAASLSRAIINLWLRIMPARDLSFRSLWFIRFSLCPNLEYVCAYRRHIYTLDEFASMLSCSDYRRSSVKRDPCHAHIPRTRIHEEASHSR